MFTYESLKHCPKMHCTTISISVSSPRHRALLPRLLFTLFCSLCCSTKFGKGCPEGVHSCIKYVTKSLASDRIRLLYGVCAVCVCIGRILLEWLVLLCERRVWKRNPKTDKTYTWDWMRRVSTAYKQHVPVFLNRIHLAPRGGWANVSTFGSKFRVIVVVRFGSFPYV